MHTVCNIDTGASWVKQSMVAVWVAQVQESVL